MLSSKTGVRGNQTLNCKPLPNDVLTEANAPLVEPNLCRPTGIKPVGLDDLIVLAFTYMLQRQTVALGVCDNKANVYRRLLQKRKRCSGNQTMNRSGVAIWGEIKHSTRVSVRQLMDYWRNPVVAKNIKFRRKAGWLIQVDSVRRQHRALATSSHRERRRTPAAVNFQED